MIRPRDLVPPAIKAAKAAEARGDMRSAMAIAGFAQDMADLERELAGTGAASASGGGASLLARPEEGDRS